MYGFDDNAIFDITEKNLSVDYATFKLECKKDNEFLFYQSVTLSDDGVEVSVEGDSSLEIAFPVFAFDGKTNTSIQTHENSVEVKYKNYICIFYSDGPIKDTGMTIANRNGQYKAFSVSGKDKVNLKIKIDRF